jgi:ABC-2 type transport system ATP-binding protein
LVRTIRDDGTTVVITTHYLEEAEALCDRVAIMDHGKILALDAPAVLVRRLDAPVRISLPEAAFSLGDASVTSSGLS